MRPQRRSVSAWSLALMAACILCGGLTRADDADDAGQADLDQAVEAKLSARTLRDLNTVVTLCESALEKGLGESSQKFAKQILSSALLDRGSSVCESIFARSPTPAQWPQMRQIALADLERALQYDPALVEAHLLVARLQMLPSGDPRRAMTAIDQVIKLTADDSGKQSEALMIRSGMREKPEDGLADLNEAVRLVPKDPKPLRARGMLKFSMKKPDEAIADLDAALVLDADDAATHEAKGLALASAQSWDAARACFDRAAELNPQSANIYLQRGRVNLMAGDMPAAAADFSKALAIEPENLVALLLHAEAIQDNHQALEDLNKALTLRPGLVPALRARAALLAEARRFDAAISDLELVRKLQPEDLTAPLQLAAIYMAGGKQSEAEQLYDELVTGDGQNWMAFRGRGDARLNQGKQREAVADYERALELKPKDSGVLNNLAWVLATSPDESLRDGKRAIELAKQACEETQYKQPHILSTLAAGYAESGDFPTAIEWSKKAIELGDEKLREALTKELQSYQESKPWREIQTAAVDPNKANDSARR